MREFWILVYASAVGFVAAGVISSLYQLVTRRQVAFSIPNPRFISCFAAVVSFALVGPYIVARNTIRSRFVDRKPLSWLAGGFSLAALWSVCSGILVLDVALAVRESL